MRRCGFVTSGNFYWYFLIKIIKKLKKKFMKKFLWCQ